MLTFHISDLWNKDETGWYNTVSEEAAYNLFNEVSDGHEVEGAAAEALHLLLSADTALTEAKRRTQELTSSVQYWRRLAAANQYQLTEPQREVFNRLCDESTSEKYETLQLHAENAQSLA